MEGEAESSRPESPKKKIKSSPASDSEAQPSNYSKSDSDSAGSHSHMNGICPNRDERHISLAPDSSSESKVDESLIQSSLRVQEEEVSSSENSVSKGKKMSGSFGEGDADSVSRESEQSISVCDSLSSDSFVSELNDKN